MTEQQKIGALLIALIVMLIFTAVMTYAYFTASAESENAGQITFGYLELNLNNFSASVDCCKNAGVIVPGCTINFIGELEINTNIDCFVRVCFSCLVNGEVDDKFSGIIFSDLDDCMKDINWVCYSNYYYKRIMSYDSDGKTLNLNRIHLCVEKEKIGNDYQGKEISFKIEAEAIQAAHISDNGDTPTNLTGADGNTLMALSQNKAWPSNNKDNSSQGQESGKSESGKDGKADDDSESGDDGKTGDEDKDDGDSTITNGKDALVTINDDNLVKYFIKVGGNYANENGGQTGIDLGALINDSQSVEIETQYCNLSQINEIEPFSNLVVEDSEIQINVQIDVDLICITNESNDNLDNIKADIKRLVIYSAESYAYYENLDKFDENDFTINGYAVNELFPILNEISISTDDFGGKDVTENYAIKFKLKIEWAE